MSAFLLSLALVGVAAAAQEPKWEPGLMKVTFLNVGFGDAILLQTPGGKTYLVDGGDTSNPNGGAAVEGGTGDLAPVVRALVSRNIRELDIVFVTHQDADHRAGLQAVFNTSTTAGGSAHFAIRELVSSSSVTLSTATLVFSRAFHPETDVLPPVSSGTVFSGANPAASTGTLNHWDPALTAHVLSPTTTANNGGNSTSLVLRLAYNRVSLLLTGDLHSQAGSFGANIQYGNEEQILQDFAGRTDNFGIPLTSATILKVPHHGSRTSSHAAFLNAVKPSLAVVSVAHDSRGLPDQDILDRYTSEGIPFLRTDQRGDIVVITNGVSFSVWTQNRPAGGANTEAPKVRVYPNPVSGSRATIVWNISGQADSATIRIYTLSGDLVREFSGTANEGDNFLNWDLTNAAGGSLANDLYFVSVAAKSSEKRAVGRTKFAVLR